MLLQGCYRDVIMVLKGCYRDVTVPVCDVTVMLQGGTWVLGKCSGRVTGVLQGVLLQGSYRVFTGCHMGVRETLYWCYR